MNKKQRLEKIKKDHYKYIKSLVVCIDTDTGEIQNDFEGEVDLYITPGYNFKAINCLITNYHLPKSTLLLLVSSFIDFNYLMTLYKSAIKNDYKFYSYVDSMFIDKML